ncbi:hypothetical protein pb186bvf_010743 [Paramecium bursaria]
MSKDTKDQFLEDLEANYDELAKNISSEDSILNLFLNDQQKPAEDENVKGYINKLNESFTNYMMKLSPEEQVKRSKDFVRSLYLNKSYSETERHHDYQDYSLFDKNMLQIRSTAEKTNYGDRRDRIKIIGDLDENIKTRFKEENAYSYIIDDPKELNYDKEYYLDQLDEDDEDDIETEHAQRLSFRAKFELFDLFNNGWTIRDLSLRYGILPDRVKAIVYQKRYFFDELLPHLDYEMVRDLMNYEYTYEQSNGSVDYGVDLETLQDKEFGYLQTNFTTAHRNVDIAKLDPKEQERLQRFFERKQTKKQDVIKEKFVGEGNRGYFLKSWIMHKTRSRHGVSQMFERVIKDSDKPYKLPASVQRRLKQGPRLAGAKFGHK